MSSFPDSVGRGETSRERAERLYDAARVFRASANDAWAEADRAGQRAREAEVRAGAAEHDFRLAWAAYMASAEAAGNHDSP